MKVIANAYIEEAVSKELNAIAKTNDLSRSDIIRLALGRFVAEYKIGKVELLPHPADATPVPVVYVETGEV